MSNTYCNFIKKGIFVSHRGISLCCPNPDKHYILPSEFWHGDIRKDALRRMVSEEKVKGCENCYKMESEKYSSPRLWYNTLDKIPVKKLPTVIDIDFSNLCNLKCVMCNPRRSSEWAKEIGKANKGVSTVSKNVIDDLIKISDDVVDMTIQGGEPSIMPEYVYYFEKLNQKNILKNVHLTVISNGTNVNNKFYKLLDRFKSVKLEISIDAYGSANDYIRWPSKFHQIEKNLIKLADVLPDNTEKVEIQNALNILSLFNYNDFLKWMKHMEKIYSSKRKKIALNQGEVMYPRQFSPFIAPKSLKDKFIADVYEFKKTHNFEFTPNFNLEITMLIKKMKNTPTDNKSIVLLSKEIESLDTRRQVNITDYIANFYKFIGKL